MSAPIQTVVAGSGASAPAVWIGPALVLALLMMGVVIGLFWYLRRRVKQQYFTLWTAAWIGYALYLASALGQLEFPHQPLLDSLGLCGIGLSGLFMCWGGLQLANKLRPQRAFYVTVALVVIYCLGSDYLVADPFWLTVTVFGLLGGMGVYAGLLHMSRPGNSTDSKVLGAGLTLWNFYVLLLPFLDRSPQTLAVSHVVVAALAVLIAIAMVLEQGEAVAERNYGSLFDAASDSIFLVDMWRLTIIKTNRAAERLAKLPADQLGGMPFGNLCPAVDRHPVNVAANEKMYRAAFRPYEKVCVLTLSGAKLVCEGAVEVVLWRQRPVFQVSLRNVTERTQMTEQIRRHERLSTVGQLVAGVAHELNNPLAIILGTAQLMSRRHQLDASLKKDLECIQKQSERSSEIVRDLLSYARPSEPNKTTVQVNRVVTEVLDWRRDQLQEAGIEVETHLEPSLSPTKADRIQLEQILTNLITNAIDALNHERAEPPPNWDIELSAEQAAAALRRKAISRLLVITTEETPSSVRVSIRDNGPGMTPDVINKIYDPFFTTKLVGRGTGLGLTICNTYIQEHSGKIWAESEPGQGTCFVVELPLLPCEPQTAAVEDPPKEPSVALPAGAQRRLLIIDDEPDIVTVLESILSEFGYATESARNGDQALEILSRETFDVILSDMRMPGMDGQALYQHLRASKPGLAKRVIFVTGDTVSSKTREFLDATGNPWLSKPFQMKDVLQRVEQLIAGRPVAAAAAAAGPVVTAGARG